MLTDQFLKSNVRAFLCYGAIPCLLILCFLILFLTSDEDILWSQVLASFAPLVAIPWISAWHLSRVRTSSQGDGFKLRRLGSLVALTLLAFQLAFGIPICVSEYRSDFAMTLLIFVPPAVLYSISGIAFLMRTLFSFSLIFVGGVWNILGGIATIHFAGNITILVPGYIQLGMGAWAILAGARGLQIREKIQL